MNKVLPNKEVLIKGLVSIVGFNEKKLSKIKPEELLQIMDHPMLADATDRQIEKLTLLKQFMNAYQYYRDQDADNWINTCASQEK